MDKQMAVFDQKKKKKLSAFFSLICGHNSATKLPYLLLKMIFSCSGDGQVSGPTVSNTGRIQVRIINNYAYSFPALLCSYIHRLVN
jgi:hypothetical protein